MPRLSAARGFLGGSLAIALALTAQHALLTDRMAAAAVGYGLAILVLLAGLVLRGNRARFARPDATESEGANLPPRSARASRQALLELLVSSSLIAAAGSMVWKSPRSRQVLPAV